MAHENVDTCNYFKIPRRPLRQQTTENDVVVLANRKRRERLAPRVLHPKVGTKVVRYIGTISMVTTDLSKICDD